MTRIAAAAALLLFAAGGSAAQTLDPAAALIAADLAVADSVAAGEFSTTLPRALTDDGLYLHPGANVMRGRKAVAGFLAAFQLRVRWQPVRAVVSSDGRAGATFGVAAVDGRDGAPALGRYIAFWRHEAGHWRIAALMHTLPVPPGSLAADGIFRPDTGSAGARGAAERADRAFAADAGLRGAAAAFATAAAPDAVMFGGLLRLGPDEIRSSFGEGGTWHWQPVASGAAGSGDLAFTVGEAEIGEGDQVYRTKYLTVWQRQSDGTWKFVTDGGNARPAR